MRARLCAAGLLLMLPASAALAQSRPGSGPPPDPVFDHTVTIGASLGYGAADTRVRLDASDGTPGTLLDAERDLGLDAGELTGWVSVSLRPRPRHRIHAGLSYLPSDRRAREVLGEDIRVGEQVYFAGEEVETELRIRTWSIAYAYSFLRLPNAELAASVGVTSIGAYAEAGVPARAVIEVEERSVPAPQLGLEGAIRFRDRWYGEARLQYVRVKASGDEGSLNQLEAAIVFQFDPNIAAGLGYAAFEVDVQSNDTGDTGVFRYTSRGPRLFIRASF